MTTHYSIVVGHTCRQVVQQMLRGTKNTVGPHENGVPDVSFVINHFASVDVYTRKTFPNCKTEDVYTRFASRLGDPGQKALQTTIEPARFVDFCLIPLSNTCSLV